MNADKLFDTFSNCADAGNAAAQALGDTFHFMPIQVSGGVMEGNFIARHAATGHHYAVLPPDVDEPYYTAVRVAVDGLTYQSLPTSFDAETIGELAEAIHATR